MSLKSTQDQLVQLLADDDNKVIALSGKWGTGKSHMWDEVKKTSENEKVKVALYASLFGVSSVDQIKLKLIQSSAKSAENYPALFKGMNQAYQTAVKALEGFNKGFSALNDIGLLVAPAMLRQKILVLDDIERKHEKLGIDEILGFIDEFTKRHDSRVMLILNDDQLDKRDIWNTLREKVIDQELRLTTSALEAFEIGIAITPSQWAAQLQPNIERCGVTNIRIVCKVIKTVNRILSDRKGLSEAVLSRVIPSTVLLASIHYKGIENGPDFDFVLSKGSITDWDAFHVAKKNETEEDKAKSKWQVLLNQLGIYGCDEYELLVVEFLQSGLFDVAKLATVIDSYVAEAEVMEARDQYHKFMERAIWQHSMTEQQLLEEAVLIVTKSSYIDPYMVTALHDTLAEIGGGQSLADQAVDCWIEAFKSKNLQKAVLDNMFGRKIHPRIEAEFNAINNKAQANTSVLEVCKYMVENSGWGTRQELVMKRATVDDFEATIRNAPINDLRIFMLKMLDLSVNKGAYVARFGSAMDNFSEACRRIAQDTSSPRLAKLVTLLFADSKISGQLDSLALSQLEQPTNKIS
jgi:DNA polymerase III delta prime subunit